MKKVSRKIRVDIKMVMTGHPQNASADHDENDGKRLIKVNVLWFQFKIDS